MKPPLAGVLIAGGSSSRFGSSKASLDLGDGKGSLALHILDAMRGSGLSPLVLNAGGAPHGIPKDVRLLPDREPGQGPMGGLATALSALQTPILVAACDMPGLDAEAFLRLAKAWIPGQGGLVAQGADGMHPLLGIYEPELLPELERRLAQGQRALHRLVEDLALPSWRAQARWLANVNTVAEWEAWKRSPKQS